MSGEEFIFKSIGTIHSPHREMTKTPIQPVFCEGVEGTVVVDEEYAEGLANLDEFSHVYLFYYFHLTTETRLRRKPYLSDEEKGIFAMRAQSRPNKLGMSLVRLLGIDGNVLRVADLDVIDGTPLLDIKPYIQRFDSRDDVVSGWQDAVSDQEAGERGKRGFGKS